MTLTNSNTTLGFHAIMFFPGTLSDPVEFARLYLITIPSTQCNVYLDTNDVFDKVGNLRLRPSIQNVGMLLTGIKSIIQQRDIG